MYSGAVIPAANESVIGMANPGTSLLVIPSATLYDVNQLALTLVDQEMKKGESDDSNIMLRMIQAPNKILSIIRKPTVKVLAKEDKLYKKKQLLKPKNPAAKTAKKIPLEEPSNEAVLPEQIKKKLIGL